MKTPGYAIGVMAAALAAVCWSMGGALVRLTDGIDAWQIIFYRSLTVVVCMGIWIGVTHGNRSLEVFRRAGLNAVIAGMAVAIAGLTFILALFYTTVAQAIFMTGLDPFMSAMLGFWILRERIPSITWIAMLFALAGMAIILYGNSGGQGSAIGTLLAVYSAFAFSCYAVLLRWGQNTEMSVALIWNALLLIAASLVVVLYPTGLRETAGWQDLDIGFYNLFICIVMGAVQLTLGLMLFTLGSKSVPAAQLSLIALIEPTLSPLWAWLVAKELPPVLTFVGGAVILGAIVLQTLVGTRARGSGSPAQSRLSKQIIVDATGHQAHARKHWVGVPHKPRIGPRA